MKIARIFAHRVELPLGEGCYRGSGGDAGSGWDRQVGGGGTGTGRVGCGTGRRAGRSTRGGPGRQAKIRRLKEKKVTNNADASQAEASARAAKAAIDRVHGKTVMITAIHGAVNNPKNKADGGSVPKTSLPAVEKGTRGQAEKGSLAGHPLSDFKATLYDGSYHAVDSSEMSFKIAGSIALQSCVKEAQPYLLEPIVELVILVPEDQMGDVLSDLNSRRGRVLGMESADAGHQRITAHVPLAETFRYATALRPTTGGRGAFPAPAGACDQLPALSAGEGVAAADATGGAGGGSCGDAPARTGG